MWLSSVGIKYLLHETTLKKRPKDSTELQGHDFCKETLLLSFFKGFFFFFFFSDLAESHEVTFKTWQSTPN